MELDELTSLFARLGAQDPERWARSQIDEGIPQLARYVFLREAWKSVVSSDSARWIEKALEANAEAPGGKIAAALTRIIEAGANPDDITEVVRTMQWRLLHEICYLLDDPELNEPLPVSWALFEMGSNGLPLHPLNGLHESVLETDPSGREMM